jgi:hypothetical protein
MTRKELFEILDKHDREFTLESGEKIQAIYFYDFEKLIDELLITISQNPVERPELKVGDKCRVLRNENGHNFEIGEIVTITEIEYDSIPYNCLNKYGVNWWCSSQELEKL